MKNLLKNKKFQSIVLWSFLIIAAVGFVFSLAYATNFWNVDNKNEVSKRIIAATLGEYDETHYTSSDAIVIETQKKYLHFIRTLNSANTYLFLSHIVVVVLFAAMCILGNKYRKKYYISNLVAGIVAPVVAIVLAIVGIVKNMQVVSAYKDAEHYLLALKAYNNTKITVSTSYQSVMFVVLVLEIVVFGLVMAYTILKYLMLNEPKETVIEDVNDETMISTKEVA